MVGRLVEQQEIGLLHNKPGYGEAFALTSGELCHRLRHIEQSELSQHLVELVLVVPCRNCIHRCSESVDGFTVVGGDCVLVGQHSGGYVATVFHRRGEHSGTGAELGLLGQIAYTQAISAYNLSAVRRLYSGDNAHKGAFACSVAGDESYFVAFLYAEAYIGEKRAVAERFAYVFNSYYSCHSISRGGKVRRAVWWRRDRFAPLLPVGQARVEMSSATATASCCCAGTLRR